jgi:hypothetical protein
LPGGQSDQVVVALILLPGAVGRGAKGLACSRFVRFANQRWEERRGRSEA